MTGVWALASLWLSLALVASLFSIWFRVSTALSEIIVGTVAQLIIGAVIGAAVLGTDETWVKFLSGAGAIVLTFLAGAELDRPGVQAQMEGSSHGRASKLFLSLFGMCRRSPLSAGMGGDAELACRGCDVDDFGGRRLCRDARIRFQQNRVWQDDFGRLLRHRPRDGRSSWSHLRAVHDKDHDLPWSWRRGVRRSSLAHASLLQTVRRPAFRARNKISPSLPARHGGARHLGPTVKRCSPPISSEWCSPGPSVRIMHWSGACARSPSDC